MKIRCVACQTEFGLEPDEINENGSMVKCLKCSYIFMIYPPDFYGSPVIQDTNIKQEILDELLEMQKEQPGRVSNNTLSDESRFVMVDNMTPIENIREEDLNPSDADYAELPDLSELEKTIDWEDINEREESPAQTNQNYNDTQELDINRI